MEGARSVPGTVVELIAVGDGEIKSASLPSTQQITKKE